MLALPDTVLRQIRVIQKVFPEMGVRGGRKKEEAKSVSPPSPPFNLIVQEEEEEGLAVAVA